MPIFSKRLLTPRIETMSKPILREWIEFGVYALCIPILIAFTIQWSSTHTISRMSLRYGFFPWAFILSLFSVDLVLRECLSRYADRSCLVFMWKYRAILALVMFVLFSIVGFFFINTVEGWYR